jgi:hypothetical protein
VWTGITSCIFIFILATTGIVLNHRDQLTVKDKATSNGKLEIKNGSDLERLPVSPAKAVDIAMASFGEGAKIRKVELKKLGNGFVYKIESKSKESIQIDPLTGTVSKTADRNIDIVRVSKMLHTGEGLMSTVLLYDIIAIALALLAVSGAVMFVKRVRH